MQLTQEQSDLLKAWQHSQQQVKEWQEKERECRDAIVKALFSAEKDEGTETVDVGEGWKLKATKKLNYSLNNKDGQVTAIVSTWPAMAQLVRWSPELNVKDYKKLDDQTKEVFNGCLTIKPGAPTLEVVAPKLN